MINKSYDFNHEILRYLLCDLSVPMESHDFYFMKSYLISCFERCKSKVELAYYLPKEFSYITLMYSNKPTKIDLRPQREQFFDLVYFYKGLNSL